MSQFDTWSRDFPEPAPAPLTGTPQDDSEVKWVYHLTHDYLFHVEGAPCGPADAE